LLFCALATSGTVLLSHHNDIRAVTILRFRVFLAQGGLDDKIYKLLEEFDVGNVERLVVEGAKIRKWIVETPFPPELIAAITTMYVV
jgi:pyruvate,water dikinase